MRSISGIKSQSYFEAFINCRNVKKNLDSNIRKYFVLLNKGHFPISCAHFAIQIQSFRSLMRDFYNRYLHGQTGYRKFWTFYPNICKSFKKIGCNEKKTYFDKFPIFTEILEQHLQYWLVLWYKFFNNSSPNCWKTITNFWKI